MKNSTVGVIKQFLTAISAALSLFVAGNWMAWPSPVVKRLNDGELDFTLTNEEISWVVSLMDFGNIFSPIPSGYISNWLGRKKTLLFTAFLYTFTWVLAAFGKRAWYLFVARFGAGFGKGIAYTVVPMYLGEIAGVHVRGAISTIFTGLLFIGMLFAYCVGPFVSYDLLNILSGTVPIIFFLTFFLLPESPYYLLMKERHNEAKQSLAWFRNADMDDETLLEELEDMTKTVQMDMEAKGTFLDLIATPGNRKALMIVLVLSALQRLSGVSSMLAYTAITLPKTGGYFNTEIYMIIFGLTMVFGNFLGTPLIDRKGRKTLLLISCGCCTILTAISTVFYWAAGPENNTKHYNFIPYVCFVTFGVTYGIGIGVIPSTFVGELFPTTIKGYASALSAICFAVCSFMTNKMYLFVEEHCGAEYIYGFFSLCLFSALVFTIFQVFETKGKTFAQIQEKLNKGEETREEEERSDINENVI